MFKREIKTKRKIKKNSRSQTNKTHTVLAGRPRARTRACTQRDARRLLPQKTALYAHTHTTHKVDAPTLKSSVIK